MRRYSLKCILVAIIVGLILSSSTIGCENKEDYKEEKEVKKQSTECDNQDETDSFSFFEKLIERYPILEQIINLLLNLLHEFLSDLDISSI